LVIITIPNCFNNKLGRDNWATNSSTYNKTFVREREQFLNFLDNKNITNVVFIATDVHFAAKVKYEDNPNNDKDNLILY
jgi:phosphodiesterase/alkaline phosphatase D-like protein